jgi:hypothetical protein
MPRPLKPTNPYASWTALFGATVQRLRQELSLQPVVTQAEFGRRVCASGSKVSAIERGQVRPEAAFVEACERELPAGGILRAMLPLVIREWEKWARLGTTPPTGGLLPTDGVPPPGEVAASPAELADVAFLEAAADGAVEAAELAREAEASDIGAGTLENIDLAVDRLCRGYASAPPALLIPRVQGRLRGLRRLHTGRVNLAQRRQLLVAGGWLATLLATLQFDAGDQSAAEDSRDAALQLGKAAGHQEIMAWSFELLAWFALVNHQPRQALDLAQQGLTLAPNKHLRRGAAGHAAGQGLGTPRPGPGDRGSAPGRGNRTGQAAAPSPSRAPLRLRRPQADLLRRHMLHLAAPNRAGRRARPTGHHPQHRDTRGASLAHPLRGRARRPCAAGSPTRPTRRGRPAWHGRPRLGPHRGLHARVVC